MKRFGYAAAAAVVALAAGAAEATSFTKIEGPAGTESNLRNIMAGILGAGYGNGHLISSSTRWASDFTSAKDYSYGGLTAKRVFDAGSSGARMNIAAFSANRDDKGWSDGTVLAETHARFASFSQGFGTSVAGQQFSVTGTGFNPSATGTFVFSTGATFDWVRYGDNGPDSSNSSAGNNDNMVTWAILDASGALRSWILAFDDGGNKNDRDFQDLIVEVSLAAQTIPLPSGAGLALVGLTCTALARRRR